MGLLRVTPSPRMSAMRGPDADLPAPSQGLTPTRPACLSPGHLRAPPPRLRSLLPAPPGRLGRGPQSGRQPEPPLEFPNAPQRRLPPPERPVVTKRPSTPQRRAPCLVKCLAFSHISVKDELALETCACGRGGLLHGDGGERPKRFSFFRIIWHST